MGPSGPRPKRGRSDAPVGTSGILRAVNAPARARPLLRGVSHEIAFFFSLGVGAVILFTAPTTTARFAAGLFAGCVTAMFGVSALYHRVTWRPRPRRLMARADHAAIYLLIAGTYTAFVVLALSGAWRIVVLAIVWSGVAAAITLKVAWVGAPKVLAAAIALVLGWVGVVALPELVGRVDVGAMTLLLAGGALYSVGAVVYALRRPDPVPSVFGYHEVFHALVVAAVACHYVALGVFVIPAA